MVKPMEQTAATEPFHFRADGVTPAVGGVGSAETLVRETRREIASIVRETAALARRVQPPERFFPALVDRVARAMGAEGVVLWRRSSRDENRFEEIARVGRQTDRDLKPTQQACHQQLLREVADETEPVVVPATPGAEAAEHAANPTSFPVALVPILEPTGGRIEYLLEVFLDPDGGPASQRGYLRFAAQMGDLAGEFLRLHQLRAGRQAAIRWERLSAGLPRIHQSLEPARVAAAIVDQAADLFGVERASLCLQTGKQTRLLAVSHVAEVDRRREEVQRIEARAAEVEETAPHFFEPDSLDVDPKTVHPAVHPADAGRDRDEASEAKEASPDEPPLGWQAAICLPAGVPYVLLLQSAPPQRWDAGQRRDFETFAKHAACALENAGTFSAIPWARTLTAISSPRGRQRRARRPQWVMLGVLAILLAVIACFPVPLIVQADGELYAARSQAVYAPRSGVVTEVLVDHGEPVEVDQVLLQMTDPELEQEYETLVGQRAVLLQRSGEILGSLLDQTTSRREESRRLQAEQRIVAEKMDAIDRQLALLDRERNRMTLRSDRRGVVDGWQLRRQLTERPVQAGDPLLTVIEPDGPWRVEARLPQNRVDLVLAAIQQDAAAAKGDAGASRGGWNRVALAADPGVELYASFEQIGPVVDYGGEQGPVAQTSFLLHGEAVPELQTGAPATIGIDCGYRPLLFVVLQDFVWTLTGKVRLYL
jgi:hypothetical protein